VLFRSVLLAVKAAAVWLLFRERPFAIDPTVLSLDISVDPGSFPSAHTMLAFGIAASMLLAGYRQLGRWLIIVALLVAFGRVAAGVHFVSDVLAGAVFGIAVAWILHHESGTLKRYLPKE
jgi:undecaprenyl-diphosphatase